MAYRASNIILFHIAFFMFSILFTYALAVEFRHIRPFIPYIGYMGDQPLESTVYTQLFVIDAAVLMFITQIRYVYVSVWLEKNNSTRDIFIINLAGAYIGYVSAIGLIIMACFQETHAFYIHHLGEILYLLGSVGYFVLQTSIAIEQNEGFKAPIILIVLMSLFLTLFVVTYILGLMKFSVDWDERFHWTHESGGYTLHILSAISQWILIVLFQVYFLVLYKNFYQVVITKTRIVVLLEGNLEEEEEEEIRDVRQETSAITS